MPPNGCTTTTTTTTAVNMLTSTIEQTPAKAEQKQHPRQRTPSHKSPATRNPTERTTTTATTATTATATTLRGYQTFQYMLAPPSLATEIVNNIVDMVFYQEPRDPSRAQEDHSVFMRRTGCCVVTYYLGCLAVFPSHALCASRWISAVDCEHEHNCSKNETANQPAHSHGHSDPAFPILRHFRYSYFWGKMEVDTYHIKITSKDKIGIINSNSNSNGSNPESFRLVEFFTFASKPFVYSVVIGFYLAVVVGVRMAMAKVFQTTYT